MEKQNKNHTGRFRHIHAYFGIFRHVQVLFRCIQNPIKQVQCSFCKNCYSNCCFGKLKLFLRYQLFTFSTLLSKSVFFTPEVFIQYKKHSDPGGEGP